MSGETVRLSENQDLETLDTPGHTLDHQVFFLTEKRKKKALFSGDTLFNAGVGNCKGGGDVNDLFTTTMHLKNLPDDILLYPGHDYLKRNLEFAQTLEPENKAIHNSLSEVVTESEDRRRPRTLGEELLVNPFFRLNSLEIREKMKTDINLLEKGTDFERDLFKKIRSLRDNW